MRAESPFMEAGQPWQRATVIVAGRAAGDDADGSIALAVGR
jgi:hypothetical protein